ncbi:hypothetical protein C8J57DRAFT_1088527, partial [Mycena rebaudengoi]
KISFAIINSTTILLPLWRQKCELHSLPIRLIPRDVATRWNSTYDLLAFAIKYQVVIDDMTMDKATRTLREYDLSKVKWCIINDLVKIFKDATTFFSRDDISSIANVIPTMDVIDHHLTQGLSSTTLPSMQELAKSSATDASLADDQLHPSVRMALLLGKHTMDRYYGHTDQSKVYRIAMSTFFINISFTSLISSSAASWPETRIPQDTEVASILD